MLFSGTIGLDTWPIISSPFVLGIVLLFPLANSFDSPAMSILTRWRGLKQVELMHSTQAQLRDRNQQKQKLTLASLKLTWLDGATSINTINNITTGLSGKKSISVKAVQCPEHFYDYTNTQHQKLDQQQVLARVQQKQN